MPAQRIIWTAIPHGADGDKLKISVFVSPRLAPATATTLDQFPDFWNPPKGHWPGKAALLDFSVEIDTDPTPIAASMVKAGPYDAPYFDAELWADLFTRTTHVGPFTYSDFKDRVIRSFPVRGVMNLIKEVYTKIGEGTPGDHPNLVNDTELQKIRNTVGLINYDLSDFSSRFASRPPSLPDVEPDLKRGKALDFRNTYGFASFEQLSFAQADRFYDRPEFKDSYLEKPDLSKVPNRLKKPDIEFHQILAALADYPELMRRLGIVIELVIPKPSKSFNKIRVRLKSGGPGFSDNNAVFPWTWCTKDGSFRPLPRPSGSDIRNGMLNLAGANDRFSQQEKQSFDVVQVDPDGSAIKTIDFGANLFRLIVPQNHAYTTPEGAALPALRSGGIGVVKFNRAFHLANHFQASATRNLSAVAPAPGSIELYADDLLRGYRIDIDDGSAWRSLCRRDGTYFFTAAGEKRVEIDDEEGYVKGASTTSKDDGNSDLYFHEMMFRWDGWSVCAKRPGKTIAPESYNANGTPRAAQGEKVTENPSEGESLPAGIHLKTVFQATKGTLPRLRFGEAYRLRARVVDLAGNSEPHTSKNDEHATEKILYGRFDPIPPPPLVLRAPITEGESVEHMVIRSNYNVPAKNYASDLNTKIGVTIYTEANERHVAAPKTSQLMAETHGMFDPLIKSGPVGIQRAFNIAKKEIGNFFDREVIDIETGEPKPLADPGAVQLITPPTVKNHPPYPILKGDPEGFDSSWVVDPVDPSGRATAAGQYLIHREERLLLPYLPDPVARGAAFQGLPNPDSAEADGTKKIPFTGTWPMFDSFRIRIEEYPDPVDYCDGAKDTGKTVWNSGTRVLTVYLGKGEIVRLRYSSYLDAADLKQMGIMEWLRTSHNIDTIRKLAVNGRHWMVTPYRELILVHAVQQPLCEPKIVKMSAGKSAIGQTFAELQGDIFLSVRSTGKIELLAEWDEPVDFLTEPMPRDNPSSTDYKPVHGQAHVFERRIEEPYSDNLKIPIAVPDPADPAKKIVLDPEVYRHEFNDTKHRKVHYHLIGTSRFREYFPQPVIGDPANLARTGPTFEVSIPNSARPDAPKILYVIPTFGWEPSQQIGNDIVSRRCGGGLRVYMDRTWYSTGEGEMLGVVLQGGSGGGGLKSLKGLIMSGPSSDLMKPYVTDWGMDPIWGSDPVKTGPDMGDFPLATNPDGGQVTGLSLDELRGDDGEPYPVVNVAPHIVEYDPERKLWFCDIVVDSGNSYYPFVRLALARYQPNSIPNAHLSRVVMAEFAQLTPDRVAAVTFDSDTKVRVMVSGIYGINTFSKGEGVNPGDKKSLKNITYSRRLIATLESPIGTADLDVVDAMGWGPVSSELTNIELVPFQQYESKMVWMAEITLPGKPKRRGGKPYRVVIKEYERLDADTEVATVSLRNEREAQLLNEGKADKDSMAVFLKDAIERLVYADTIEL